MQSTVRSFAILKSSCKSKLANLRAVLLKLNTHKDEISKLEHLLQHSQPKVQPPKRAAKISQSLRPEVLRRINVKPRLLESHYGRLMHMEAMRVMAEEASK